MAVVRLLRPMDQPPGTRRLLSDLRAGLLDPRFKRFRCIVAYAKSGPLNRLFADFQTWRTAGGKSEAIFGIDQKGTSREALELALHLFDEVYVTQEPGITFHPKIYLWTGDTASRAFVGSNNLTVGGTETNFESALQLDLEAASDKSTIREFEDAWSELLPHKCPATRKLDKESLAELVTEGMVLNERAMRAPAGDSRTGGLGAKRRTGLALKPPSALPKLIDLAPAAKAGKPPLPAPSVRATARGLAIQIKPHHNGEVFLSLQAVRQHPAFFRWPFRGATTPKKKGNPSYPQLEPDPVASISVYGLHPEPLLTLSEYGLNTIFYEKKKEIRVTASPLVGVVPDYSVMIMELSELPGIDYEITIHTPASPDFNAWLAACNQEMPGGGKSPRKFGWF